MKLLPLITGETGAICLENFKFTDDRGVFTHIYREIDDLKGTNADFRGIKNIYNSFNRKKGTFRGYHKQTSPFEEAKIINCVNGKALHIIVKETNNAFIYDTNIISSSNFCSTFVPRDCYSAFLTLEDFTMINYLTDANYNPDSCITMCWKDVRLRHINYPISIDHISDKDNTLSS